MCVCYIDLVSDARAGLRRCFMEVLIYCRVKSVVGFDADDFVGTKIEDYFHPADQARMIPCAKLCTLS